MDTLDDLARLSDADLLAGMQQVVASESHAIARVVAYLAELDRRRLYLVLGFTSLFKYCTQALHLSEDATFNRIEVARAARRHPVVLTYLASGDLTLTAIRLLAPHLTSENYERVLSEARHKGLDDIRHLIARHKPQPPVPSMIRKLPSPPVASSARPVQEVCAAQPTADVRLPATGNVAQPVRRPAIVPLSEEHYKIQVTFTRRAHDKLRQAQALLRHQLPGGDPAVVLERALDALVEQLLKKKAAAVQRRRAPREAAPKERHISADVKRKVWARDCGQCAFKSADGRRCSEMGCLEYHHVVPFAAGGQATADNIELRCRAHNGYEAARYFGAEVMSLFRESAPAYR